MSDNYRIEGNELIIKFDPDSKELSTTGKSFILATSNGYQYKGEIGISFNIIKRRPKT